MTSSVIYNKFRHTNLQRFMASLVGNDNPLYIGIGRPYDWNTTEHNDNPIGTAINSIRGETLDWKDMMFMKRVSTSDVMYGMIKTRWEAGRAFDQYRTDWDGSKISVYDNETYPTCIAESRSFVVNAANKIYACLKQPAMINGEVPVSTQSPELGVDVGSSTNILKTADGYYWKYIATATSTMLINFASSLLVSGDAQAFFPVLTLDVDPGGGSEFKPQWDSQVLSANFKGGIYAINITANGSGYNGGVAGSHDVSDAVTDSHMTVKGDGTGLQFTVTYAASGVVSDIHITNPGSGYTHATVTAVGGIGFAAEVIYTPMTGLGCDPAKDVDAVYLLISTSLTDNEGGIFTVNNDYRKISLVSCPKQWNSTTPAVASTLDCTMSLTLEPGHAGSFVADSTLTETNNSAAGKIVDFDVGTRVVRIIRTSDENNNSVGANALFQIGAAITTDTGGTGTISAIGYPQVTPFSGDVIYSEYRNPISRSVGQTEAIHCIVQF